MGCWACSSTSASFPLSPKNSVLRGHSLRPMGKKNPATKKSSTKNMGCFSQATKTIIPFLFLSPWLLKATFTKTTNKHKIPGRSDYFSSGWDEKSRHFGHLRKDLPKIAAEVSKMSFEIDGGCSWFVGVKQKKDASRGMKGMVAKLFGWMIYIYICLRDFLCKRIPQKMWMFICCVALTRKYGHKEYYSTVSVVWWWTWNQNVSKTKSQTGVICIISGWGLFCYTLVIQSYCQSLLEESTPSTWNIQVPFPFEQKLIGFVWI